MIGLFFFSKVKSRQRRRRRRKQTTEYTLPKMICVFCNTFPIISIVHTFLAFALVMFTFVREKKIKSEYIDNLKYDRRFWFIATYLLDRYLSDFHLTDEIFPANVSLFQIKYSIELHWLSLSIISHSLSRIHTHQHTVHFYFGGSIGRFCFLFSLFFVTKNGAWYEQKRKIMCFSFSKEKK